jgi:hypothetical protein
MEPIGSRRIGYFANSLSVSSHYRNDDDVCKALELARAFGSLDLKKMDEHLRYKVMQAIKAVAQETINGSIEGWRPHDQKDRAMYCEALSELVKLIQQQQDVAS